MRFVRRSLVALALISMIMSGTAHAADPPSGTLSKSKRSARWSGSFTVSQPDSVGACFGGAEDPICDHYMLKINLGDGARIRVQLPAPSSTSDIDLFVFAPTGAQIGVSEGSFGENEVVEFRHSGRYRNKVYEVRIKPWLVAPGTAYKATAKVR